MKDAFKIIIDTLHVSDAGDSENVSETLKAILN